MRYAEMASTGQFPYPNHHVSPDKKNGEWCMDYAKAAYYDTSFIYPKGMFSTNNGEYEENRMYALGKQPVTIYKKLLGIDTETNETWRSCDWSIRPVISLYRDKAISKLMKEDYGFICTPIDMLAKTEQDEYYVQMKAKLAVRQLAEQENPELAQHPLLSVQKGEPEDLEELEMRFQMGEQFNRSKDAELAIELGMYENDYKNNRRRLYEDLFDIGVCGVKDWLGDDNKAKFRVVNPEAAIVSYGSNGFFDSIVHAGEVIQVSLIDLATEKDKEGNDLFTEKELQEFASSVAGKFGNPRTLGYTSALLSPIDKFKCNVLDIEFFTYNEETYSDRKDKYNNPVLKKEESGRGEKENPRYKRKSIEYVYKCKWIVGTDKCYDWGMCYDQPRKADVKKKAKTRLSYTFCAYNFYKMRAQSYMTKLKPYLDDYQLTMLHIQNFKNRAIPSGWWIDLDSLENVALTKGGKNMDAKQLLQMFAETGILTGRSKDQDTGQPQGPNWKPIIPIQNTILNELVGYYNDLLNTVQTIERITGFNDVTMGNANPKTLVPGYEQAAQSTNDALYPLAFAEEYVSTKLAENVLCRQKQGIRKVGSIEGFAPALGSNTLRAIKLEGDFSLRDHGIQVEKKSSQDERMWLLQQMQQDILNKRLDSSDAVTLVNTHNVKQAQMIWAFKVKKSDERMQAQEMAKIKETNKGTQQAAQIAQQGAIAQQQQLQEFELQKEQMRLTSAEKLELAKIASAERIALQTNQTKLAVSQETADAKVASTDVAGAHQQVKQEIANQKPTSSSK